jgi:chemosensory pili system protein ChpA (sensor histidine kinase/response regulator)
VCRLLVVEDDRDTNDSITELLSEEEYSCLTALDGEEGLALLEQHRPDLVLLDLELPRITGFEFLLRKAAMPSVAGIPVIVITTDPHPPRLDEAVATLLKPFQWEELLDTVRKFAPVKPPAA